MPPPAGLRTRIQMPHLSTSTTRPRGIPLLPCIRIYVETAACDRALLGGQNFTFKWTINLLGNWECTDNVTPRPPVRSRNEPGQRPDLLLSILSLGCPRHVLTPQPGKTFKKILLVNPSDAVDLDKSLHHLGPQQPHQQSGTSWLFFSFFFLNLFDHQGSEKMQS